ncbi:TIGR04222 domain-containing membrane protein [Nocardiopsis dassonvillei]|uniref:TIGR04222 domain-containing membrane protein n=1 Tax=Nocardiopsis dassonvillei TaxID=2014 RepID=UPI000B9D6A24|nr:TIGR04222 domain-containing membrane protein [Nocardiopsis dassonvillei]ASU57185.1 TIGR04222 domain-containing membrane protein [Nocardiopsis dassonvillei]
MDPSLALPLVAALIVGLVVGGVPLSAVLRGASALGSALRRPALTHQSPPDPDELEPNELALLAGGPVRVGETAVMDAFLHGRIRQQPAGGLFTLVGPSRPYTHEKDAVRRELVRVFRKRVGVSALEMLRRVVAGQGVEKLRTGLAGSDLIVDSPQLRRALRRRERAPRTIRRLRSVAILAAAAGAALLFLVEPGAVALGLLVAGLSALASLVAAQVVMAATGGPTLSPNTPRGNAVLESARRRYGALETGSTGTASIGTHPADAMTRDHAVRHTALTGFRSLRASASRRQVGRARSDQESAQVQQDPVPVAAHAGGDGPSDTAGTGGADSESVTLESLCLFAELCQGPGGSDDRSVGNEGWGGDFGHYGDGGGWGGGDGGSGGSGWGGGDGGGGWGGGGDGGGGGGGGGGD